MESAIHPLFNKSLYSLMLPRLSSVFLEMNAQRSSDKGVLDEIWSAVEFLDSQKETKEDHSASQALGVHSRDGMLLASAVAVCAKMKHRSM